MKEIKVSNNHSFFEFNVNELSVELDWAKKTSTLKAEHTVDTWQKRGACKRFTNLFLGDLAKNIFKRWMIEIKEEIEGSIVEYDQIRTDSFFDSDLFDLKLECKGKTCTIEVKSSGEKYTDNVQKIYEKRRIIININSPHSHLDCVYTQVIFIPKDLDFFKNNDINCESLNEFVNEYFNSFKGQNIKAYIVGYANRKMQEVALNRDIFKVKNINAGTKSRTYANLLIKESKSPNSFIKKLNEFC